jgi:cell wall-associated NlpC family hydrolase
MDYNRKLTSTRGDLTLTRAAHVLKEPKRQGGKSKSGRDKDSGDKNYVPGQKSTDTGGTASTAAREKMVKYALAQSGKAYVWGGNGPNGYDCSGLVQAASRAAGKTLTKPAASQWAACRNAGKTISVSAALKIRGALLFRIGVGDYNHVAISLGNGSTVEARGTGYGCGVFGHASSQGWTGAALWV